MKMTFRWYGEDDPVTLKNISQIPTMDGIVSACYDVPVGKEWREDSINKIKNQANAHNSLQFMPQALQSEICLQSGVSPAE